MSELRELYQSVILDHNNAPRNFRELEGATHEAHGDNPLCGDQVDVYVRMDDGIVADVGFRGSGCAISTAAASMMTERVIGKPIDEVMKIFASYRDMVTAAPDAANAGADLGKLAVFEGVREYPMRVKCATLAWHTLKSALGSGETVSTES